MGAIYARLAALLDIGTIVGILGPARAVAQWAADRFTAPVNIEVPAPVRRIGYRSSGSTEELILPVTLRLIARKSLSIIDAELAEHDGQTWQRYGEILTADGVPHPWPLAVGTALEE
jgi:hypothetical protein